MALLRKQKYDNGFWKMNQRKMLKGFCEWILSYNHHWNFHRLSSMFIYNFWLFASCLHSVLFFQFIFILNLITSKMIWWLYMLTWIIYDIWNLWHFGRFFLLMAHASIMKFHMLPSSLLLNILILKNLLRKMSIRWLICGLLSNIYQRQRDPNLA